MTPNEPDPTWKSNRPALCVVLALIALHVGLGFHAASRLSVTNDEFWHLPVGYWNLTTGRFHYENLNPPLARMLSALPLIPAGAVRGKVDEGASKEARADAFVAANRERYQSLLTIARCVPILLSALTAWLLADWALHLFGRGAALLAAAMWCFSPNVIAHASLVTTDIAAALAILATLRAAWQFAEKPTTTRAGILGLLLGLAQLTKFTCLLLVPLIVLTWFFRRWRSDSDDDAGALNRGQLLRHWGLLGLISLATINVGYLFRGTGTQLHGYQFESDAMKSITAATGPLAALPVPLPKDYMEGIDRQRAMMESDHPTFLDGELRFEGGFPDYYIMAVWYKMPHATQLLVLLGVLGLVWQDQKQRRFRLQLMIVTPVIVLFAIASCSTMQLGIRYILPAFPFAFLFASQIASVGRPTLGLPQALAIALATWLSLSVRHAPHHLTYFNELAGGPEAGSTHLLDSNVDWGQGLNEVRQYADENGIDRIWLAYFGAVNPADLGIRYAVPQHAEHPKILWPALEPGVYAISKNFVQGRPGMVRDPDGTTRAIGHYEYGYFRFFTKARDLGNCIEIYELSAADIAAMPPNPH